MSKTKKRMSASHGLPPGTLVHIGTESKQKIEMYLFEFNREYYDEESVESVDDIESGDDKHIYWLNINGISDIDLVTAIGKKFNLHHLMLEDIVNSTQRPKLEEYSDSLHVSIKMLTCDNVHQTISEEQVSVVLVKNWIITFQERPGDVFETIRNRIRTGRGKVRTSDAGYLFYVLLDCIVDNYFYAIEMVEERIDALNLEVGSDHSDDVLHDMNDVKNQVNFLKRVTWPLRELTGNMLKNDAELLSDSVMPYVRDLDDHVKQIHEAVFSARDAVSGLFDLHASAVNNSMNRVMKVLTIMSAMFIPISFLASFYGMNFEYMPELHWKYAYETLILIMIIIAVSMLVIFKKKKWW